MEKQWVIKQEGNKSEVEQKLKGVKGRVEEGMALIKSEC